MHIGALSIVLSQSRVQQSVGIAVMKLAMDMLRKILLR
jgi:hypothetical protein